MWRAAWLCAILCAAGVGGVNKNLHETPLRVHDLPDFQPVKEFPSVQVLDPQSYLEEGADSQIRTTVARAAAGATGFHAYAVIVGRMQAEGSWPMEDDTDLIEWYANAIKKEKIAGVGKVGCEANCVLFVLSVGDRALKLKSSSLTDAQEDYIVESAKYHLRERDYTNAVLTILKQCARELDPHSQDHAFLFFLCTFLTFSGAAVVMLRTVPFVWLGLLAVHLFFQHWLVLLATVGVTAFLHFVPRGTSIPQTNRPDPWANV